MQEDHHDHLVCLNCNKVIEFTNDVIEKEQHSVASAWFYFNRTLIKFIWLL
jgi:Fe2+ or Zn2+ uptake regulation protein